MNQTKKLRHSWGFLLKNFASAVLQYMPQLFSSWIFYFLQGIDGNLPLASRALFGQVGT